MVPSMRLEVGTSCCYRNPWAKVVRLDYEYEFRGWDLVLLWEAFDKGVRLEVGTLCRNRNPW